MLVVICGAAVLVGSVIVIRSGVLLELVPAWTVPVAVSLAIVPLLLRRRTRMADTRQAFLVTSAFSQKYWVAEFVQRLHRALDRKGINLVLKVPDRDYDAASQGHDLRRVLNTKDSYLGGFVVPTELHRMRPLLVEFCAELALPVVFTDVDPFDDESEYPANTSFVGYVSSDLGTEAGRWLVGHLRQRGVRRPHVLIVASREHSERQKSCADVLRTGLGNVSISIDDTCAFSRSRAYDAVQAHIRSQAVRSPRLDAMFCTNDEMALGAVDALRATDSPLTRETTVIGIDGIPEARHLIATATSPLRATVVQDPHRLTESAAEVLQRMLDGRQTMTRTILKPEVYQIR
ncbi:ribose transport system substrate-binding protein [Saccharothrix tamanrassetensis]|uniref:Ribose transport system substrate-binding protein n=1 Tax=Saccharothrix tamanrassetensis TaxID=1051531 RepID=A0A841CMC1_9PSEU|nr:substrate-binding domain-containing protein [Saccharothrix tamanrassetensis]MBB5958449.1 ribose transport system substrate-binding protein [Saccharothrix tamanrassetensis]